MPSPRYIVAARPFLVYSYGKTDSLKLLVLNQDEIVELLVAALSVQDTLAAQPLLDLTSQLARDLGDDFRRHFDATVFDTIADIVSPINKEPVPVPTLEQAFQTLTFCFKYLYVLNGCEYPPPTTNRQHLVNLTFLLGVLFLLRLSPVLAGHRSTKRSISVASFSHGYLPPTIMLTCAIPMTSSYYHYHYYQLFIRRRSLVGELDRFFVKFKRLLGKGSPTHVRRFAAESYGFLLRKLPASDDSPQPLRCSLTREH